jgi:4a-hydroxytetrahydrobiopterin dehydratase
MLPARRGSAMPKLKSSEIEAALAKAPEWARSGPAITRVFQFKDFAGAIKFVNAVARRAEKAWHHPDIDIRWNKVTLTLSTHAEGGLTQKDFKLAQEFDALT